MILGIIIASSSVKAEDIKCCSEKALDLDVTAEIPMDPQDSWFFRVRGTPSIHVTSINGNIDMLYNPDIEGVQVDLYVTRRFSLWSGTRSMDDFRIIVRQQGDRIIASVEERRSGSSRRGGDISFHFVVQTPGQANTQLRTVSGEITLDNHEGDHFLQNQSGDINITNTEGTIQAASTSGNISIEEVHGIVFAKTVTGNIDIMSSSGEIRLRSVSGNVTADSLYGTLIAASTTGNVTANFHDVSRGVFLETVSGDVMVVLPSEIGYKIDSRGMSFNFRDLIQDQISGLRQRSREISLTTGDGEIPVELSTVSGRVTISHSD